MLTTFSIEFLVATFVAGALIAGVMMWLGAEI